MGRSTCGCCEDTITTKCFKDGFLWNGSFGEDTHCVGPHYKSGVLDGFLTVGMNIAGSRDYASTFVSYRTFGGFSGDVQPLRESTVSRYHDSKIRYANQSTLIFSKDLSTLKINDSGVTDRLGEPSYSSDSGTQYYRFENRSHDDLYKRPFFVTCDNEFSGVTYVTNISNVASFNASGDVSYKNSEVPALRDIFYEETVPSKFHIRLSGAKDSDANYTPTFLPDLLTYNSSGDFCVFDRGGNVTYSGPEGVLDRLAITSCFSIDDNFYFCNGNSLVKCYNSGIQPVGYINNIESITYNHINSGIVCVIGDEYPLPITVKTDDSGNYSVIDYHETSTEFSGLPKYEWNVDYSSVIDFYRQKYNSIASVSSGGAYQQWLNGSLSFELSTPNDLVFSVYNNSHTSSYSGQVGMFNDPILTIHSGFIPRNSTAIDISSNASFNISLHRSGIVGHTPYNSLAVFNTDLELIKYNYIPYSGIIREQYISKTPDSGIQPTRDLRFDPPPTIIQFVEHEENVSGALEFYNRNLDRSYTDSVQESGDYVLELGSDYVYNRSVRNKDIIWLDNITNEDSSFLGQTTVFPGTLKRVEVYRQPLSFIDESTNSVIESGLKFWKDISSQYLKINSVVCENDKTYVTIAINTPVEYHQYSTTFGIDIEDPADSIRSGIQCKRYELGANVQFPSGYATELCSTLGVPYDERYVSYSYGGDAQLGVRSIGDLVENNNALSDVQYNYVSTGNSYDTFYHSHIEGTIPGAILTVSQHPNGEDKIEAEGTCMDLANGPDQITVYANYVDIPAQTVSLHTADFITEFDVENGYDVFKMKLNGTSAPDFGTATMGVFTRDENGIYFYGMGTANAPFETEPYIRVGVGEDTRFFLNVLAYGKYLPDIDWSPVVVDSPYYTSNNTGGSVYITGEEFETVYAVITEDVDDFPIVRFVKTGDLDPSFPAPAGGGKTGANSTYWDNGFFGAGNVEILRSYVLPKEWTGSGPADAYNVTVVDSTPIYPNVGAAISQLKRQALLGTVNYQYQYGPFDIQEYLDIIYNVTANSLTDYLSEPSNITYIKDNYPFITVNEYEKKAFPSIYFQDIVVNVLPVYELYLATYDNEHNLISIENYENKYNLNLVDYSDVEESAKGIDRFKINSDPSGTQISEERVYNIPFTSARTLPPSVVPNTDTTTAYYPSYVLSYEGSGLIRPYWNKNFRIDELDSQNSYYGDLESNTKYVSESAAFVDISFIPAESFNRSYDQYSNSWMDYTSESSGLRLKTDNFHDKFYTYNGSRRYLENFPNDVDSGSFLVSTQNVTPPRQKIWLNYSDYDNKVTDVRTGSSRLTIDGNQKSVPFHAEFTSYMILNGASGINRFNVELYYAVNEPVSEVFQSGGGVPLYFVNDNNLYSAAQVNGVLARIPYSNGVLGSGAYASDSGILVSEFYGERIDYTQVSYRVCSGIFDLNQQGVTDMVDYFNQNLSGITYVEGSGELQDFGKIAINVGYDYYDSSSFPDISPSFFTFPLTESLNSFSLGRIYFDYKTVESGFKIDKYRDIVRFTTSGTIYSYDLNNVHYSTYSSGDDRDIHTQFGALTRAKSQPISIVARDGYLCTTGNIISDNRLKLSATREDEEGQIISAVKDFRVKDDVVPH